jgi:hypothetical protein
VLAPLLSLLLWTSPALADSASGRIYTVPGSDRLEGRVTISHECEAGEPCQWSAAVSAYGAEAECPQELELANRVWSGQLHRTSATANAHFRFTPEEPGAATLCMYVVLPLEIEDELLESISEAATAPPAAGGHSGGRNGGGRSGGGSEGGPGSTPVGGSGSGGSGGSPTSSRTHASVYRPFRANGTSTLRTRTLRGYCWSGSEAADRRDAWRCTAANEILDPCFSAHPGARSVLCPSGPWSSTGVRLKLTRPLPRRLADRARPSLKAQPWAIELTDGRRALFSSGASSELGGQRLNYFFGASSEEGLWGYPDRATQPWTILLAPFDAHELTLRVALRRAWM